jgi:hypothetical protein
LNSNARKISHIESYDGRRSAVDSSVKHKFIAWVAQLRPPQKMTFDWFCHRDDCRYKNIHFIIREASGCRVFPPPADSLIFESQRDIR